MTGEEAKAAAVLKMGNLAKKQALDAKEKEKKKDYGTQGKMKSESYRDPLLPQKNIQARESEFEFVPNFPLLGAVMSYDVMFFLYASFLGKKGSDERVMIGLFLWTTLLMWLLALQVYIFAFIRLSVGTLKVLIRITTGLFLVSSFAVFILLQLGVFQALEDK